MTIISDTTLRDKYSRARLARDARFDGLFFTAVTSTGIYCRPICPASPPKEVNVIYHDSAVSAADSGFRPCLRCRPDSAPNSSAWQGTRTTLQRALSLIHAGALQVGSLEDLSDRLGVSSRHMRGLFQEQLGVSPKSYSLYQQCLFAKQLLHESSLPITQVAYAAGFNSVRRFNEAMQERLKLSPSQIRKQVNTGADTHEVISLKLHYRPPFAWPEFLAFLERRLIPGLEWTNDGGYGRTFCHGDAEQGLAKGYFEIRPHEAKQCLELRVRISDLAHLHTVTQRIRQIFDLDAPIHRIDEQLKTLLNGVLDYQEGLRIPGIWNGFEAGIRAILGQQVSVSQAHSLVTTLVNELGEKAPPDGLDGTDAPMYFPTPQAVANSELAFFKMPQARKDTLRRLAMHVLSAELPDDFDSWLDIKGIGPWTVNYVKLRAAKDPDVWLAGDAGVKNALKAIDDEVDVDAAQPWRSYLVFQLWNQL